MAISVSDILFPPIPIPIPISISPTPPSPSKCKSETRITVFGLDKKTKKKAENGYLRDSQEARILRFQTHPKSRRTPSPLRRPIRFIHHRSRKLPSLR